MMKWPQMERVQRQARQMDRMMDRLGVDAVAAARQARGWPYARACRTCLGCPVVSLCSRWLDSADGGAATTPDFCPNAALFDEWRQLSRPN